MPTHMTAAADSVTNDSRSVLESATDRVLCALRHAWTSATKPRGKGYARNLSGEVFSRPQEPRIAPVHQTMALLRDAFDRGASEADLLAYPDSIRHEIESWFVERDADAPIDFGTAHVEEERAESEADIAEAEFQRDPSFPNLQKMEHKHRVYETRAKAQLKAARRTLGMIA